jgi:hypothetical protein
MPGQVIAQVVVRSPEGTSMLDAPGPVGAETVARHRPSADALREAATRLRERGFDIVQEGPTTLTIAGDKELFERTFATAPGAERAASPEIPQDLSDLVAGIAFPRPPELHP